MDLSGAVAGASPHRLIALLLRAAIESAELAKISMEAGDRARKSQAISKAYSMIEGLRMALDHEKGGEISARLDALYEYCTHCLLEANLHNECSWLAGVHDVLQKIETAWLAISPARLS